MQKCGVLVDIFMICSLYTPVAPPARSLSKYKEIHITLKTNAQMSNFSVDIMQ